MPPIVPRRSVLFSLVAIPAAMTLAACSDSGDEARAEGQAPADAAKPAQSSVEARAVNQFHYEEQPAQVNADSIDCDDARVA